MSILGGNCSCFCGTSPCAARDYTPTGYDTADLNQYLGQSFVTPSGGLTLTKATLGIAGYAPLTATLPPGTYTNYPRCRIYSSATTSSPTAYVPDTPLVTLTGPTDINAATWEFTHAGYSLSGSTRYWIVLEKNGDWNFYTIADCNLTGDGSCCEEPFAYRSTLGGAWNSPGVWTDTPYVLTIN